MPGIKIYGQFIFQCLKINHRIMPSTLPRLLKYKQGTLAGLYRDFLVIKGSLVGFSVASRFFFVFLSL